MSFTVDPPLDALPTAEEWFAIEEVAEGVWSITEPHLHPLLRANSYLVHGRERDLLVDAGNGLASLRSALDRRGLLRGSVVAVATHTHFDHIGGMHEFGIRLVHPAEASGLLEPELPTLRSVDLGEQFLTWFEEQTGQALPALLADALPSAAFDLEAWRIRPAPATGLLEDGDAIRLGGRTLEVLHLPGHSPGQIGLIERSERLLFTGDAVYDDILLDEHLDGSDISAYIETMHRLRRLDVAMVLPGHGAALDTHGVARLVDAYLARRL